MTITHSEWFHDLYFPEDEHHARLARARTLMDEYGFDGLFLTDDRTTFYYGGFGNLNAMGSRARPRFLFLPRNGNPIQLCHQSTMVTVGEMTWIADVRGYAPLACPVDDIAAFLSELGLANGRIGAEIGPEQRLGISLSEFRALEAALPAARFEDAGELLWRQRFVKSPRELDKLRRACDLTTQGYLKLWPRIRPGMTEGQVRGLMTSLMAESGARDGWAKVMVGCGEFDRIDGISRDRVVERGDFIYVDAGANVGGYFADFVRNGVLGTPSALQVDYHQRIWNVTQKGIEACRPGVPCSEVWRVCEQAMAAEDLSFNTRPGRYGHGMGLFVTEPPHLSEADHTVIEPGMVLTMEPGYIHHDALFHIEENFVIHEDGVEILSNLPWELYRAGE
jgi:Xaa-Pro dipeptidase